MFKHPKDDRDDNVINEVSQSIMCCKETRWWPRSPSVGLYSKPQPSVMSSVDSIPSATYLNGNT